MPTNPKKLEPPRALDPTTGKPVPEQGIVKASLDSRVVRSMLVMALAFLGKHMFKIEFDSAAMNEIVELVLVLGGAIAGIYYRIIASKAILPQEPPAHTETTPPTPPTT